MTMRATILASALLLAPVSPALAQISVGVGVAVPGVQLGIDVPVYPELLRIPGYPVYFAPNADANYFFCDGAYWLFVNDGWYMSTWYNGPWHAVAPASVPYFVLRVPVAYYRRPPPYFHAYRRDAPPRWGERFGRGWEGQHRGWGRWDRRAAPRPAPLPLYQREYAGARYPRAEEQHALHARSYGYRPSGPAMREHYRTGPRFAPPGERRGEAEHRGRGERERRRGEHDREHEHDHDRR